MPLLKEEVLKNCILIILSSCFFWKGESSRTTPNAFATALVHVMFIISYICVILIEQSKLMRINSAWTSYN